MESSEENLKNTENAFKDMYSRLHNVPRADLEDIPVDELTNLESSLVNRANKVRFREIKAVNSQTMKKEDLGKKEYSEEPDKKIVTPEVEEVKTDNKETTTVLPEKSEKLTTPIPSKDIPDITDLDKKLKAETAMLPEPPSIDTPVEKPDFSPEQEKNLRTEYPFFDFDKKPTNTDESKRLDQIKRDLLAKLDEKKIQSPVETNQNITVEQVNASNSMSTPELTIDQEQKLRTEYPFFDFNKKPADEKEAKWLDQFKKDLLAKLDEKQQLGVNQTVAAEQPLEKPLETITSNQIPIEQSEVLPAPSVEATNLQTNQAFTEPPKGVEQVTSESNVASNIPQPALPEPMAATIESLKNMNVGNLNEMIDQMTAIAMGFQKNAPINEASPLPTSSSESSLKSINDNIANLNKVNTVSTKELKSSIDGLRAVAEQILQYLPNIQSNNIIANNSQQTRDIQQINTGLIQRYKNEVRQQYGSDIIDLSNNRPTMPGFTI